jgi:hypothetical protein
MSALRWLLDWAPYALAVFALAGDLVLTSREALEAAHEAERRAALNRAIGRAGYLPKANGAKR